MSLTKPTQKTKMRPNIDQARQNSVLAIYIAITLIVSLCPSSNSLSINQRVPTQEQHNKRSLRSSDDCNGDLQYSSYIQLDSVCKLCASYLRDYPEIYGQCR